MKYLRDSGGNLEPAMEEDGTVIGPEFDLNCRTGTPPPLDSVTATPQGQLYWFERGRAWKPHGVQ